MASRCVHFLVSDAEVSFFITEQCSSVCVSRMLFIHPSPDGYTGHPQGYQYGLCCCKTAVSLWWCFHSFRRNLWGEQPGQMQFPVFVFWGLLVVISIAGLLLCLPNKSSLFPCSRSSVCYCLISWWWHSFWSKVESQCRFNLHFSNC